MSSFEKLVIPEIEANCDKDKNGKFKAVIVTNAFCDGCGEKFIFVKAKPNATVFGFMLCSCQVKKIDLLGVSVLWNIEDE